MQNSGGGTLRRSGTTLLTIFFAVSVAALLSFLAAPKAHSTPYYQVVDNSTSGRFSASSKWISSNYHPLTNYGASNRVLKRPGSTSTNAKYKIKTPAKASYRVLAYWPSDSGYNNRARFYIKTPSGWKAKIVNQRRNGGKWVYLGLYTLDAGDSYRIQISSKSGGTGYIIADAVKIVRATTSTSTSTSSVTGSDIVRKAQQYVGYPYTYGGNTPSSGFDCSGLTQYVYSTFNINLPRTAYDQYSSGPGRKVSSPQPGDLLFGNVDGSGIDHVGIYAGNGYMIHAGNSNTGVERTTYKSWYNVVGIKRIVSN